VICWLRKVDSTGLLGEDGESAISDAEQVHVSHNANRTHCVDYQNTYAWPLVTLSEIIAEARRQNPENPSQTIRSATDEQR
jgi:hypothetical protein